MPALVISSDAGGGAAIWWTQHANGNLVSASLRILGTVQRRRRDCVSPVRPLRQEDLPEVTDLYEMRLSGGRRARHGMVEHFQHQFLAAPTVDPDIPSLVATDGVGRVIGFLGASVVPMMLDDQRVGAVVTGPLFTEPDARLVSVLLLRSLLAGPQALTFSDKHNLDAHRLFVRLGARVVHPRCVWWDASLRPVERRLAGAMARRLPMSTRLLRPVARLADGVARRRRRLRASNDALVAEPLTPALVARHLDELTGWARLRPVYEEAFLSWRFEQLGLARRLGPMHARALRDVDGGLVGWFVLLVPPGGVATAVQVVARDGSEEAVLEYLIAVAEGGGAVAVRGRLEPELAFAVRGLSCTLHQRACLLVHTTRDDVWDALTQERTFLTLLDGEPWLAEMHEGRST